MLDSLVPCPFSREYQLCDELDVSSDHFHGAPKSPIFLPGQPCINLADTTRLSNFLEEELWAKDLETIASRLWVMTTPSSANINSLHAQRVKGREIIITEDPRLHLVWIHNRVFIKPIPQYLLSYQFWNLFQVNGTSTSGVHRSEIRKAALGYLRTYVHLIRHQSDFLVAQQEDLHLIPKNINWIQFCRLLSKAAAIKDTEVSGRYYYGELRLTRLNLYAKLFLHKSYYEQVCGQYADYFARLYGPILFVFALASTMLNAIQVEMASEQVLSTRLLPLVLVCSWVGRVGFIGTAFVGLCMAILWLRLFLDEWVYTLRCKPWRRFQRTIE